MRKSFHKKTAFALFFVVFIVPICSIHAQSQSADSSSSSEQSQSQVEQSFSIATDPSQITLASPNTNSSAENKSPSTIFLFVKMILVLAVVIAIIYAIVFLMKRGMKQPSENDPFLRNVTRLTLSPGKSVQVVTLVDHAYLVGVTDNNINLIAEITDKELIDTMNLYFDKKTNTRRPRSFSDVLDIFLRNTAASSVATEKKSVFSESAENAVEAIKRQRKILNDGGIE